MIHLYSKTILPFLFVILLLPWNGTSQTTQPITNDTMETFNSSGENATGASGSVTYSIGQVFYTYIGESVYNVAQGIQQQQEVTTTLSSDETIAEPKTEIVIFPNPTTDFVNIQMEGSESDSKQHSYQLYDLQGRLLKQESISQNETQVNMTDLRAAIYLLNIYNDNKIFKTFKIVKN